MSATFETESVSEDEMRQRISDIVSSGPYLVYEADGRIAGYCYAHAWKERSRTLETTIYLSEEYQGKGIGRKLMTELIEMCRRQDYYVMIACITSENEASRAFYQKLGFKQVSLFEKVGVKFSRRLDVTDYELLLKP